MSPSILRSYSIQGKWIELGWMVLIIISPASVLGPSAVFNRVLGPPGKLTFAPPASSPHFTVKWPSLGTIVKPVGTTGAIPFSNFKIYFWIKGIWGNPMDATGSQMMSCGRSILIAYMNKNSWRGEGGEGKTIPIWRETPAWLQRPSQQLRGPEETSERSSELMKFWWLLSNMSPLKSFHWLPSIVMLGSWG